MKLIQILNEDQNDPRIKVINRKSGLVYKINPKKFDSYKHIRYKPKAKPVVKVDPNKRDMRFKQPGEDVEKAAPINIMELAYEVGIDWNKVNFTPEVLRTGFNVELEHSRDPQTDVVYGDMTIPIKIAWAHLKEDPKYYEKLATIEKD